MFSSLYIVTQDSHRLYERIQPEWRSRLTVFTTANQEYDHSWLVTHGSRDDQESYQSKLFAQTSTDLQETRRERLINCYLDTGLQLSWFTGWRRDGPCTIMNAGEHSSDEGMLIQEIPWQPLLSSHRSWS